MTQATVLKLNLANYLTRLNYNITIKESTQTIGRTLVLSLFLCDDIDIYDLTIGAWQSQITKFSRVLLAFWRSHQLSSLGRRVTGII